MYKLTSLLLLSMVFISTNANADDRLGYKSLRELNANAGTYASGDVVPVYDLSDDKYTKVSAMSLIHPGRDSFNICGEATTINNNTVYYGPSTTLTANTFNGQACDINAVGNTTEATADEAVYTSKAVQVVGMTCRNEGDANAAISFTLRTAAGATVPSVTCTIADNARDCVADIQTTTAIAAGATVAIAAASTADVGDNNGFVCKVDVVY